MVREAQGSKAGVQRLADRIAASVRADRARDRGRDAARLGTRGRRLGPRRAERRGRPDHRLSLRPGPGDADGRGGRHRPRAPRRACSCARRRPSSGWTGSRRSCFDKTGTVTEGKPRVTDVDAVDGWDRDRLLRLAAAAESGSEHPLARALAPRADGAAVDDFQAVRGGGVRRGSTGRPCSSAPSGSWATRGSIPAALDEAARRLGGRGEDRAPRRRRRPGRRRDRPGRHPQAARPARRSTRSARRGPRSSS